jgi:hypothetical protein
VYWDSPEAEIPFGFNEGEDVCVRLKQRVTLLKQALQKPDGYKAILQHAHETLNTNQVFKIRNKCVFLIQAYLIALEKMGINNIHWKKTAVNKK